MVPGYNGTFVFNNDLLTDGMLRSWDILKNILWISFAVIQKVLLKEEYILALYPTMYLNVF